MVRALAGDSTMTSDLPRPVDVFFAMLRVLKPGVEKRHTSRLGLHLRRCNLEFIAVQGQLDGFLLNICSTRLSRHLPFYRVSLRQG
jgi:hypothetical protein